MMSKGLERDDSDPVPDWTDPPWNLLFPGLSEERASRILKLAESAGLSYGGELQSPRWHLSLGLDRVTAQWLRAALASQPSAVLNSSGNALETLTPAEAVSRLDVVIELLDEFLNQGDEYPIETAMGAG